MIVCGIDPGVTGAIAWLDFATHKLLAVGDLPVAEVKVGKTTRRRLVPAVLAEYLKYPASLPDHAFLEEVATRPGEGAVGAFAFGRGFGQIEGVLAVLGIPYTLVRPAKWKKALGCPSDKGSARMLACQKWPQSAGLFARVKDDGRAEAALIALYGASQRIGSGHAPNG